LDDGPDLIPVDQFDDGGAAMADELSIPSASGHRHRCLPHRG
jgi:hypothetical protein